MRVVKKPLHNIRNYVIVCMMTATKKIPTATPEEFWAGLNELRKSQNALTQSQRETDKKFKETDKKFKKLEGFFSDQWGKLMESLIEGDLIELLQDRKIDVIGVAKEHKRKVKGKDYEIDLIAINGEEVVVVEVKTTLGKKDVDDFINKLKVFKDIFKEYKDRKIYGAVAYLKENSGSAGYSQTKGLFVIRATGSSASIINKKTFSPKLF